MPYNPRYAMVVLGETLKIFSTESSHYSIPFEKKEKEKESSHYVIYMSTISGLGGYLSKALGANVMHMLIHHSILKQHHHSWTTLLTPSDHAP